jgi:hypothetical protein
MPEHRLLLSKQLGTNLQRRGKTMTSEEFRAIQQQLADMTGVRKITRPIMADIIGKDVVQVSRYRNGGKIPENTVKMLYNLIDFLETGTFGN